MEHLQSNSFIRHFMQLEEHITWLSNQRYALGGIDEICQCGTEKVIRRSDSPERMRAELLSYVFLDQFIYTHYLSNHSEFKLAFPGPVLVHHSFGGHATPNWFVYSYHGYDKRTNWQIVCSTFLDYINGGYVWLQSRGVIDEDQYREIVREEIDLTFEEPNKRHFFAPLELGADKVQ